MRKHKSQKHNTKIQKEIINGNCFSGEEHDLLWLENKNNKKRQIPFEIGSFKVKKDMYPHYEKVVVLSSSTYHMYDTKNDDENALKILSPKRIIVRD